MKKLGSIILVGLLLATSVVPAQASTQTIDEKKTIAITPTLKFNESVQWEETDGAFVISKVSSLDEENSYCQSTAYIIPLEESAADQIQNDLKNMDESEIEETLNIISGQESVSPMSTGGSNYKYAWDESISVKLYTTVYYDLTTISGVEYIGITKVTGGYYSSSGSGYNLGNGVYLQKHYIDVGQTGKTPTVNYKEQIKRGYTFIRENRTWTYFPNSYWEPIATNVSRAVGVTYYADLKRAGSSWTASMQNMLSFL